MIGEGIKKIPAYKCTIPYDQLNSLKEKFWNSRLYYKRACKVIRECCESDADTAVILLEAAEMACVKDNLREVMILTNPEIVFKVPNYCICDPVFERDYEKIKEENKDIAEEKIVVLLYYLAQNKTIKIHATNRSKVSKLKEAFAKKMDMDLNKYKIRMLFRGQELLDENRLCYNKVENMSKIQVMANKIEE